MKLKNMCIVQQIIVFYCNCKEAFEIQQMTPIK